LTAAAGSAGHSRTILTSRRSAPGYECRFALVDAVCAAMIGKPSEAERLLVRIVRECPAEPAAAVNLAALYVGRGMLDEARDVLANIPAAPPQTLLRARIDMLLAESIAP
jgi:thioredoxin-like negative regulator of GroEL